MFDKVLIYFLLLPAMIFSQSFQASVNNNKVGVNDQLQVSFTFSGKDINGLKDFSPPAFNNFLILSGPNQSTSMQIINSAISASKTYSYYLRPKSLGKYSIGSASINLNGKIYKTEPITIEVIKGSVKPNNSQSPSQISKSDIADNLFIRAAADKKKVFQGEQVTITYKLYTRLNIASQMSINKLPQYQGFWVEELTTPNSISFNTEVVNGKQYRVGVLKKVALFPSRTGNLSVTPFELNVPVQLKDKRRSSGNIFDDFFNDPFFDQVKTVDYDAKSNTLNIEVVPLPDKNVPGTFNGVVGDFTLDSQLDKNSVKTNEAINLKLKIRGSGNIKLIDIPEIKVPTGFEKYDPKVSENINRSGNKISGSKEFNYLLIPRVAGKMEIPSVKFSYFDLSKKEYVTLSTPEYNINIEQGEGTANIASGEISKENIKLLDNDIRYIKTSTGDISRRGNILVYQYGFWIAAGFPLLLLAGFVTYKKRTDKLYGNAQLLKFQKAQKIAKARLKQAKDLMNEKNQAGFYSEISLALYGFLEDKLHISKSEFSLEEAAEKLKENNIDESIINNLKQTAEKCEFIRFAPQKDGLAAMNEIYNQSANIIIEIEKSFSSKKHI